SPARAFYQGADLLDGDVSLPPPRRGGPLVADAEADLGRALRLDRVADENGVGRREVGETGQQRAIGVPRATEAEVPAQEEDGAPAARSEEHTSELQSRFDLVCRLLLEKKKVHAARTLLDQA